MVHPIKMNLGAILGLVVVAAIFLLGVWIIVFNYYVMYLGFVRKQHAPSPGPLVGGLFCFLILRSPFFHLHYWAWLPLILDPGCVFLLGVFIYTAIASRCFKRDPRQVAKEQARES